MKKLAYVGKNSEFFKFISTVFDGEIILFDDMEEAGRTALAERYTSVIATAPAGKLLPPLSYDGLETYASLHKKGIQVYAELYDSGDYNGKMLFGFMGESTERAFFNESLVMNGKLLQARCSSYIPGRGSNPIVTIEDCIGSHTPVIPGTQKFPAITRNGSFTYSAVRISEFDRLTMLPHERWCDLFAEIFAPVLDCEIERVKAAFTIVWPKQKTAGQGNTVRDAVKRAVDWHFDSGVIADLGRNGCYEMIRSHDLHVRHNNRTDTMLITAALMCSAGKYFNDRKMTECGENIVKHCFDKGIQEKSGSNAGIFHWYEAFGLDAATCYSSDNGRDGMAMLQLYRITGNEEYLESAIALGDAYLRWTGGTPYFKTPSFSLNNATLDSLKVPDKPTNAPVFYEGMAIVLANLHRITGDDRYKAQLKATADAIYSDYPNYSTNFSPLTKSFLYSRLITVLCAAQEIGCGDYSMLINEILYFFEALQNENGGIDDSELIMTRNTMTHPEFSVSMGHEHDSIMDLLYCLNNLLGCFSLIGSMTNPCSTDIEKAEKMRRKLIRFTLDIQITEDDKRLKGGWMRAYDMSSNSYFGVNKDKDWGAYCIMGGWVMGFVPLLLMAEDGIPSIYSIGK